MDSSLALKRTEMGVLLLRPGGVLVVVVPDADAAAAADAAAIEEEDVGDVARLPTTDVVVEPERLLLLPLRLLLPLLPARGREGGRYKGGRER